MSESVDTLTALFERAVATGPDRDFLHVPADACRDYSDTDITLSYAEGASRVAVIAAAMQAAGYGAGHRVALALDNRPEFFCHFLALARLRVSIVPLNAGMGLGELRYVAGHADVVLAITHAGHAAHLRAALPGATPLHVIADLAREYPVPVGPRAAGAEESALLNTSGTTGLPKGCILSHEYFSDIGRLYSGLGGYCRFNGVPDRLATPLPVTHMNALACSLMAMLTVGGCLIQLDRFHPATWWQSIRRSRATAFHYLGVMPGAVGELLVRRAGAEPRRGFFSGYYKDDAATDEAWSSGWFHSGDLASAGDDGSLFFVDRSKNIVRRSGENIGAVEVESALLAHPEVAAAAVCPVADELRSEEVLAFVILQPGIPVTLFVTPGKLGLAS